MEISGKAINADLTRTDTYGAQDLKFQPDFCTGMLSQSEWELAHIFLTSSVGFKNQTSDVS